MSKVKVYKYQWVYWDALNDADEVRVSEIYVTNKHIKKKMEQFPKRKYEILGDSELEVDSESVISGVYHPEYEHSLILRGE